MVGYKKTQCSRCASELSVAYTEILPVLCLKCSNTLRRKKAIKALYQPVTIYNGKTLTPDAYYITIGQAFGFSEKRFRALIRDGTIPTEYDTVRGKRLVDIRELDRLVRCGEIQIYNPGKKSQLSDEERQAHKRESAKKYRENHRKQINDYVYNRKQTDPVFKLSCQVRNTVYQSFARTGNAKSERCEKITGLSQDKLIKYLTATYKSTYGKEWDGKEPVHIDHIIPLATAETKNDVMRLCHYTNLQLLKAEDNLAKSDNLNYQI